MKYEQQLRDALSKRGDLELQFADGHTIAAHSFKLAMASTVLSALMDDVMDDQIITAAKRRKAAEGTAAGQLPSLKVEPLNQAPCPVTQSWLPASNDSVPFATRAQFARLVFFPPASHATHLRLTVHTKTGWRF